MATTNLGIVTLSATQTGKSTTINTALEKLDNALNATEAITITADRTLSATEFTENMRFELNGTPGASFLLYTPASARFFVVSNDTDSQCTVQVTGGGGTSVAIPTTAARVLFCDGADIIDYGGTVDDLIDPLNVITDATTARTHSALDRGAYIKFTSGSAIAYTIAPDSTYDAPIGTVITFGQHGAGQITLTAGAGVTINAASLLTSRDQYSVMTVIKVAANEWVASGDFTAS